MKRQRDRKFVIKITFNCINVQCNKNVLDCEAHFTDLGKYVRGEKQVTFDIALSWCNSMGGQLPYIHTQEDMDFFLNQATDASYWTWIGLKRTNGSCLRYLDGSLVDYNFRYATGRTCSWCSSDNCALLITSSNDQRQAYFTDTSNSYRSVCIIKVRNLEKTLQSMNTSIIHFSEMIKERQDEFMKTFLKELKKNK